jgi:hypothetical protein
MLNATACDLWLDSFGNLAPARNSSDRRRYRETTLSSTCRVISVDERGEMIEELAGQNFQVSPAAQCCR